MGTVGKLCEIVSNMASKIDFVTSTPDPEVHISDIDEQRRKGAALVLLGLVDADRPSAFVRWKAGGGTKPVEKKKAPPTIDDGAEEGGRILEEFSRSAKARKLASEAPRGRKKGNALDGNNIVIHNVVSEFVDSGRINISTIQLATDEEEGDTFYLYLPQGASALLPTLEMRLRSRQGSKTTVKSTIRKNTMKQNLKRAGLTPSWYQHGERNYSNSEDPNDWNAKSWKLVFSPTWNKTTASNFDNKFGRYIHM